jgi:hypothetical protein
MANETKQSAAPTIQVQRLPQKNSAQSGPTAEQRAHAARYVAAATAAMADGQLQRDGACIRYTSTGGASVWNSSADAQAVRQALQSEIPSGAGFRATARQSANGQFLVALVAGTSGKGTGRVKRSANATL